MNNTRIYGLFRKMGPDEETSSRMLSNILRRKEALERRSVQSRRVRIYAVIAAAVLGLFLAGGAALGIRNGWFSPNSYTVQLDQGDVLVFEKGIGVFSADSKVAPPYEIVGRMLSEEEFSSLALRKAPEMYCSAYFKQETGELVSIEGKVGNFSINMAVPEIAVTDTIISGNPRTSIISGIPVNTAYFVMPASRKSITLVMSAAFRLGDINIYITAAGRKENGRELSRELGALVQDLIRNGEPGFSSILY